MNILGHNFLNKENKRFVLPGTILKKPKQTTNKSFLKEITLFSMNACQLPK